MARYLAFSWRTRASETSATTTVPRARLGAVACSQRASPGARRRLALTTSTVKRDDPPLSAAISGASGRERVVGLDDLLYQLVADDVGVIEVDEADAFDVLHDAQRFDQA